MKRSAFVALGVVATLLVPAVVPAYAAAALAPVAPATPSAAQDLVAANPQGRTVLVAVINYENVAGRGVHDRLAAFARANPDIKIVVKPVAGAGPLSEFLAKAAYAAARQGRFAAFHDGAIAASQANTYYSLRDSAPLLGLDWSQFQRDFQDPAIAEQVKANAKYAADHKIAEAPAFIAGEQVFAGPWEKLDLAKVAAAVK